MEISLRRLKRIDTAGWWMTLIVGLGLLAIVAVYLTGARPGDPSSVPGPDQPRPSAEATDAPATGTFLQDYDANVHDQMILGSSSPAWGDTIGFLAKFGFILILLYGSLRVLKKVALRQQGTLVSSEQIAVLEARYLSSNRALYLVSAGSKVLLLGGTDHQITLLAELDDVDIDAGELASAEGSDEGHMRASGDHGLQDSPGTPGDGEGVVEDGKGVSEHEG